jgi:hypothetical protein
MRASATLEPEWGTKGQRQREGKFFQGGGKRYGKGESGRKGGKKQDKGDARDCEIGDCDISQLGPVYCQKDRVSLAFSARDWSRRVAVGSFYSYLYLCYAFDLSLFLIFATRTSLYPVTRILIVVCDSARSLLIRSHEHSHERSKQELLRCAKLYCFELPKTTP